MDFEDTLKVTYSKLRRMAEKEYKKGQYEEALLHSAIAGKFMYTYNLIYADKKIDLLLQKIGRASCRIPKYEKKSRVILVHDIIGIERRGEVYIYINALKKSGYTIIYMTRNIRRQDYTHITELVRQTGGKVIVDTATDYVGKMKKLHQVLQAEQPEKVFVQPQPDDVSTFAVLSAYEGKLERYMINITDHAFWLGTLALDYCMEFRSLGYIRSYRHRKIDKDKLFILPYYPYPSESNAFAGFPFDPDGKRIIYSGGALNKLIGGEEYFRIVSYILDNYEDTILYYTGSGSGDFLNTWIKEHGYENRFYVQDERDDLDMLIQHCYFFLNTYPIPGGLMMQYAVKNGKIPLTYAVDSHHLKQLFLEYDERYGFIEDDYQEFIQKLDHIMKDKDYLEQLENYATKMLISEEEFQEELEKCMNHEKGKFTQKIDTKETFDMKEISMDRYGDDYKYLAQILFKKDKKLKFRFWNIYLRRVLLCR